MLGTGWGGCKCWGTVLREGGRGFLAEYNVDF